MTGTDEMPQILTAIADRLDNTRDLLEVATTHLRALEEEVKRHEYTINDLHWDAARILTSDTPQAVTGPAGQRALRAVQLGTEELAQDIQRSTTTAGATHQLLTAAGQELSVADRLIGELTTGGLNTGGPLPAVAAVDVAVLAGRTERLSMLLEVATPLAERVQQQLSEARSLIEQHVTASAKPYLDRFQQFWALDVGILEGSRAVAQARAGVRDGSELAERAVHAGAVTLVQVRELRRHHTHHPPPATGPIGPIGPTIRARRNPSRQKAQNHVGYTPPPPPHPPRPWQARHDPTRLRHLGVATTLRSAATARPAPAQHVRRAPPAAAPGHRRDRHAADWAED